MRWLDDTIIALLVLGARRPVLIRSRSGRYDHEAADKGTSHRLMPGHGDLLVMGGACQAGWEHSVPQVSGAVAGRISVQWRWTSKLGRMERGGSYRAPRHYSRR
jgi:alkylated DNA repair dioxygenase AlkB